MAGNSGKYSKSKDAAQKMAADMKEYANYVKAASEGITKMMKGNGTNSYWQGEAAANWYKKAIKYINLDIQNYKNSYKVFSSYAKYVGNMLGKKEGAKGQAALKNNARYNGSEYLNGVVLPTVLEQSKLPTTLPSTVDVDKVNDNYNKEAKNTYNQLVKDFTSLTGTMDKLITEWGKVKQYSEGDVHSAAGQRITKLNKRKDEIVAARDDLRDDFTGDLILSTVDWQ